MSREWTLYVADMVACCDRVLVQNKVGPLKTALQALLASGEQ